MISQPSRPALSLELDAADLGPARDPVLSVFFRNLMDAWVKPTRN